MLANPWKETLRDAMGDIKACREAAKVKVRTAVWRHAPDEAERKRLFTALKADKWTEDAYLRRMMRKHWKRGHNHTLNQIIVRSDSYTTFELGGRVWIKIPGLERGERIAIPLNTTVAPTGTLRLILRNGIVEVHYTIEVEEKTDCGDKAVGVDKGFTEVLTDSDGEHHGTGLGDVLKDESDYLKTKYQRRS
ncbi:MAG: transposase, partial [Gammaproteobacteria bacterium]|nr:transposase [Gammaproteobacteria bacterium]